MKRKYILAMIGMFLMSFNAFSDSTIQDNKEVLTEITPGPAKIVSGYKGAKREFKLYLHIVKILCTQFTQE